MLIIIKEKNNVHIALTAWGTADCICEADMLLEENLPLWRVENAPKCLMATTGVSSLGYDLLRYGDFHLRTALTPINLVTKIIPAMKEKLEAFDQLDKDGDNWGGIVIAKGNKVYHLACDFCYEEIEESLAIGRDSDVARGALRMTRGLPALERIKEVCRIMETTYKYKEFPVVVMSTATQGRTVLYDRDVTAQAAFFDEPVPEEDLCFIDPEHALRTYPAEQPSNEELLGQRAGS